MYGFRLEHLKKPDLPNLAKAICAYMRRLPDIQVHGGQAQNISYVRFEGQRGAFQVVVRGDDWAKIVPYLQSDALSPPPQPLLPWRNIGVVTLANIDVFDAQYYNQVLGVLNGLFPQDFPTSYL